MHTWGFNVIIKMHYLILDPKENELQSKTLDDESIVENESEFWDENVESNVSSGNFFMCFFSKL